MTRTLNYLAVLLISLLLWGSVVQAQEMPQINIQDTVIKVPLAEDVSMDDAVDSMKLRANSHNFKLVAHQPLYKELQAMGEESKRIEIFQFCDARIAKAMIAYDKHFAAYLPCRIVLYEDDDGKLWLITLNLDMMIHGGKPLPSELMEDALRVREVILDVMNRDAAGDF